MQPPISPNLPMYEQPKGLRFFMTTFTGYIIVINAIVFLLMSLKGGFWFPSQDLLLEFGAKDPVSLAKGEYWRLFTPIFVHIGFIHFIMNNLGLYFIGYQLEKLLGARWYLALYLLAGLMGNIASSFFSLALSAGASGALFGLLGCGFFIERRLKQKLQKATGSKIKSGIYTSMVVLNIVFGFMVPGIDNAAHMGGLITGIIVTYIMYRTRPNKLYKPNVAMARAVTMGFVVTLTVLFVVATSPTWTLYRLKSVGLKNTEQYLQDTSKERYAQLGYYHLTQALKIDSENTEVLFERAKILYLAGEEENAISDFRLPLQDPAYEKKLTNFIAYLEKKKVNAWVLKRLLSHSGG